LEDPGEGDLSLSPDAGADEVEAEANQPERFSDRVGPVKSGLFYTTTGPVTLEYEEIDGHRVFEGDILLPPPAGEASSTGDLAIGAVAPIEELGEEEGEGGELLRIVGRKWKRGKVPYVIPKNFPNKSRILWAMSHIENRAGVDFVRRRRQRDFITFRRSSGCASYVGRQGGRQIIYLAGGCSRGNTVHELLDRKSTRLNSS